MRRERGAACSRHRRNDSSYARVRSPNTTGKTFFMYRILQNCDMQPAEITFITEVEKRPCLYNSFLTEYNRKDVTDEAWKQVGEINGLSIGDCKEKWRNIRSSFLRSLKSNGQKTKRPYYLADYLKFVMPFMKPLNNSINIDTDGQQGDVNLCPNTTHIDPLIEVIKIETNIDFDEASEEYNDRNGGNIDETANETEVVHHLHKSSVSRKQRRLTKGTSSLRSKLKRHDTDHSRTSTGKDGMRLFFVSLLPEFDSMSEDQLRMFKIKVMMLIDDIKGNYSEMRQNLQLSSNTERLQKRLINLLLKNLKRNT